MLLAITIVAVATALWLYVLANDPTVRTWRNRFRVSSQLVSAQESEMPRDIVAVLPVEMEAEPRSKRRRRRKRDMPTVRVAQQQEDPRESASQVSASFSD